MLGKKEGDEDLALRIWEWFLLALEQDGPEIRFRDMDLRSRSTRRCHCHCRVLNLPFLSFLPGLFSCSVPCGFRLFLINLSLFLQPRYRFLPAYVALDLNGNPNSKSKPSIQSNNLRAKTKIWDNLQYINLALLKHLQMFTAKHRTRPQPLHCACSIPQSKINHHSDPSSFTAKHDEYWSISPVWTRT